MGRSQLSFAVLLASSILASGGLARGQSAQDKAAADAAFDQGKRLMASHSYAEACRKLGESLALDPGIGTMLGLADCYEKNGQTASAWAQFREAAASAARKRDAREQVARENALRIEPLLSKLVIHVARESETRGLQVKRDGVDVGRALWESEVPLDPGVHAISAAAPGRKGWEVSITIASRPGVQTVNVPVLDAAPEPPQPPPIGPVATGERSGGRDAESGRTQRMIALGVGGVGIVGLAVGTIFGVQAKSKLADSNNDNHCDAGDGCDAVGLGLRKDAKSAALGSTIFFVVGAAAVTGGVVLWLTAPKREHAAHVGLVPAPGGASLVGSF